VAYYATSGSTVSPAVVGPGLVVNSGVIGSTALINQQSGTSYTFATTDAARLVTFTNVNPVTATMPAATTNGYGVGFSVDVQNNGPGAVTITTTGGTINGMASLVIPKNRGCSLTSNGTNYQVSACPALP
jgi:hypothetical protein